MELPEREREGNPYPSLKRIGFRHGFWSWNPTKVQFLIVNWILNLLDQVPIYPPPGSGLLETPLGVGLDTRFQVRNNPLHLERKDIEQ